MKATTAHTGPSKLSRSVAANGFTVIELLATLGVLLVLVSLLLPALSGVRERGRAVSCLSQLRLHGTLISRYVGDYSEAFPYALAPGPRHPNNANLLVEPPGSLWSYEWAGALWHGAMIDSFYESFQDPVLICPSDRQTAYNVTNNRWARAGPVAPLSYRVSMACYIQPGGLDAHSPQWNVAAFRVQRLADVAFPAHKALAHDPFDAHDGRWRGMGREMQEGPPWESAVLAADGAASMRRTDQCVGGVVFPQRLSDMYPDTFSQEACFRFTPNGILGVDW